MSGGGGVQSVQGPGGFSPSTLLALIKTVDGTSSGLDADLVRGTTPTTAGLSVLALVSIAAGGLILGSGANAVGTLAIGTSGYVLRSNGTTAAWAALDAGDISAGTLAAARGGTGVSNAGTLTNASNTTITGGGTLALGGFTLTVPATGTAALLATANAFTAAQTIQAANGLTVTAASTQDAIRIAGRAGGTGSYIGTITPATLSASRTYTLPDADLTITGGGTFALGGFTLTVPATGTAALLGETQTITGAKTFSNTIKGTKSGSGTAAALVLEGGDPIGTAWKFTGGGVDAKTWDLIVTTNEMRWRLNNDAEDNSATWLSVIRSGLSLTSMTLGNATSGQVIIPATTGITLSIASTNAASITTAGGVQVANGATATPSFNFAGASSSGLTYSSGVAICEAATRIVTFANGAVTFSTAAPTTFQNTTTSASVILSGGMQIATGKNLRMGTAAIATNATDGFFYAPTCAGTPTGTPTTLAGTAPVVIDTTNHKLYFYSGGSWRDAGP